MIFRIPELMWAGGDTKLTPEEILKSLQISYTYIPAAKNKGQGSYEVDLTPEQLGILAQDGRFDVLISGDLLAFDHAGRRFRQR